MRQQIKGLIEKIQWPASRAGIGLQAGLQGAWILACRQMCQYAADFVLSKFCLVCKCKKSRHDLWRLLLA
jgi:hypothetical protein